MRSTLPDSLNLQRLAHAEERLEGIWAASRMPRVAALAESIDSDATVTLRFSHQHPGSLGAQQKAGISESHAGPVVIQGQLVVNLVLICQRCLQPFVWQMQDEFELSAYSEEQAERLGSQLSVDSIVADTAGYLDTQQLIEDEILVRLPTFPAHATLAECDQKMLDRASEYKESVSEAAPKESPFAILKNLK